MPNPCANVPANPWCPRTKHHWEGNGGATAVAAALTLAAVHVPGRMEPALAPRTG